jgi:lysozyme family protein
MLTIDQMIDDLLMREGGYVNNPADTGGPTNFGITEQRARAFGYNGDMRDLPEATARSIYELDYWTKPGFDQVAGYFPVLANELFDFGVNSGSQTATIAFQRVLNVLNRQHTDYPDIVVDGSIGQLTIQALAGYKAARGAAGENVLLAGVKGLRAARYISIAENNPSQEIFEYGWLNRLGDITC